MKMLKIENLTKKYGDFIAVDNISLDVPKGIIYGFLGPNGAGKTTTIKSVMGLLKPTRGKVFIDSIDLERDSLKAKSIIGYVPDEAEIYDKLTGLEYLEFVGNVFQMNHEKLDTKVRQFLELFRMDGDAKKLIESYSHGMKQKIQIIAAFIHEPKLLIIDEPMVGLDPQSARLFKDLMKQYCDLGNTIFMSTHILEIAEKLCERVGIINKGKIIAEGTVQDLRGKGGHEKSLEDIFLSVTGGTQYSELTQFLQ